ncbi:DUF499 domain-containing protein [soil metagenome]
MSLKPWYTVVSPREDIRENKSLDMAEFAVHLDHIRDGRAPEEYQKPEKFFDRTFLTQNLLTLSSEMVRRLSGETAGTSAVFNMATQFGGGKTHSLTLLYHLAKNGERANNFTGVKKILEKANVSTVPKAETAVFVGTEFDAITGRGGDDGTPLRKTPWGEIAFQLGGAEAFALVKEHEEQMSAPGGEVIRKFLPEDKPCLILLDEIMNYVSRTRKRGGAAQFYNFLQNLSEEARARKNVVLCVSLPASIDIELNADDLSEYNRIQKLLDRLGKPILMSEKDETSEIIRRRLFEWDAGAIDQGGRIILSRDALQTCNKYGDWVYENKSLLGFEGSDARQSFISSYPFHPSVLSVFERKWASLPTFQQTRGVLRMMALWLNQVYKESYQKTHRDPLITLGIAPLEDSLFRSAVFDQLGERRLETAITSDICGKDDAHAVRLDREDVDEIKKSRLHRKVATTIFFESNGGQGRSEATLAEIRMAVATPETDIGNIETVLQSLTDSCFYLNVERGNKYKFSLSPNLNKLLADRRANVTESQVQERLLNEIRTLFTKSNGVERVFFPERSNDISDRATLTFVILPPDKSFSDQAMSMMETMTKDCGSSARVFKSALIWCVPEDASQMRDEAKKLLAWEAIADEAVGLNLEEPQRRQLNESNAKAKRDFSESVFRTYKNLVFLNAKNELQKIDLGLITSSAGNLLTIYLNHLRQNDIVTDTVSAGILVRKWNPAFKEWNTKSVRDAFFSSPKFPRLLNPENIKLTIANGVSGGVLAYVAKGSDGSYDPFIFNKGIGIGDIEISEDTFIITKESAEEYQENLKSLPVSTQTESEDKQDYQTSETVESNKTQESSETESQPENLPMTTKKVNWEGEIPLRDWTRFYKVITKFSTKSNVKIKVNLEAETENGFSENQIEEIKFALSELGLSDEIKTD